MGFAGASLAWLLSPVAPPSLQSLPQSAPSGELVLRDALVVSRGPAPRRGALTWDSTAQALARGAFTAPKVGDELELSGGAKHRWEAAAAGEDGWLASPTLENGYAYFQWDSPEAGVRILDASAHALAIVNGEPRAGDPYAAGFVRVPVAVRQGGNDALFLVSRGGRVRGKLVKPRAEATLDAGDATLPDLARGEATDTWGALVVSNNTTRPAAGLRILARDGEADGAWTPVPTLPPLSVRKVGFQITGPPPGAGDAREIAVSLVLGGGRGRRVLDETQLSLRVRDPQQNRKVTFRSAIDGSIQYYAWVPAAAAGSGEPARAPGLVLALHGAGVEGLGHADCYAPKPGLHIAAPTNRRPYGFDWEDWGRLDALEVLDLASRKLGIDPARVYLTGHSMGGHGTWQLGALFPDRFAAIAPSAGWISFSSYAGMKPNDSERPIDALVRRAASSSDTAALLTNYTRLGVYVLHGDADDNVPVREARAMRDQLSKSHPDFVYHEQPGAGHWWGNACVDWPPIFETFARRAIPKKEETRAVDFTTPNPAISSACAWLSIEQAARPPAPARATLELDRAARRIVGKTENAARLTIDLAGVAPGKPLEVDLDGIENKDCPFPNDALLHLRRSGDRWVPSAAADPNEKGPRRGGPFKDAFRNQMIFVYGTRGDAAENAWAFGKARYDAEVFWVRGNGSVDVVADSAFDPNQERDRSVVLYGNADTNSAWKPLLGESPVAASRGAIRAGSHEYKSGDLGLLLVRPRPGSAAACVAAVTGSGIVGMRLTDRLPYFVSGVGVPDWLVIGVDETGRLAPRSGGFFGNDWGLDSGDSAY